MLLWGTLSFSYAHTTNTIIEGTIKGAENKILRLYTYEDMLTNTEKKLTQTQINNDGKFKTELNISEVTFVFFRIDFSQTALYIENGKTYKLLFDDFDSTSYNEISNPFLNPPQLFVQIENSDSTELNHVISEFDKSYNQLIADFSAVFIRGRNEAVVRDFKNNIQEKYGHINNPYFKKYSEYRIALLEQNGKIKPLGVLFKDYIFERDLLLNNTAFMEFLNQFFSKYFTNISKDIKFRDLEFTINELVSYPALIDSVGKDSILRNEQLREIVAVKILGELWQYPGFIKDNITKILLDISTQSKFSEIKIMAENQLQNLTGFETGKTAPVFTLQDFNNSTINLSNYTGKFVLLFFFKSSCVACINEMDVLKDIASNFSGKLEIIGVSLDMNPLQTKHFLENKNYNFSFAHFDFNYDLLDGFKIRSVPFFILFDKGGKISRYPAAFPSERLVNDLTILIN